jgi:hypothetical protein
MVTRPSRIEEVRTRGRDLNNELVRIVELELIVQLVLCLR